MIFGKVIDAGIVNLCLMCTTRNHASSLPNTAATGGSSQLCYTVYGSGLISTAAGEAQVYEDTLTDMSHMRGITLNGTAGQNGVIWVGINPINEKTVDYSFIKGAQNLDFVGVKDVSIIVCLRGEITANSKIMKDLSFATVYKDQKVNIVVPEDSTAIVLWLTN